MIPALRFHFMAVVLSLVVMGCASTPATTSTPVSTAKSTPQPAAPAFTNEHPVSGDGSSSDRATINAGNQQIMNSEHAIDGNAPATSTAPYQGIP
jgi:hypothetical protein